QGMQRRLVEAHAAAEKQGARAVAAPVQPVGPIADFLERELLERARGSAGRVRDLVPRAARQQRHVARLQPGPFHTRGAQPRFARADEVKPRCALVGEADAPGLRQLAAPVRDAREPEVLQDLAQRVGRDDLAVGRMAKHLRRTIMECANARGQNTSNLQSVRGDGMTAILRILALVAAARTPPLPAFPQQPGPPAWVQRGLPGAGHAALAPLAGTWRTEVSIYGTMGRSPDLPPIVSRDVRTTRVWVADGQYLQDTTEGTVDRQPYWRRG